MVIPLICFMYSRRDKPRFSLWLVARLNPMFTQRILKVFLFLFLTT